MKAFVAWFSSLFAKTEQVPIIQPMPPEEKPPEEKKKVPYTVHVNLPDPRKPFFDLVRKRLGALNQTQVDGFNTLIDAWEKCDLTDLRWFAYMLATAWHETAFTMQPIRERGGEKYLKGKKYWPYFGRGYVQLTWKTNYARYGISDQPERALDPALAAHIMIDGMTNGIFTGKKLADYFGHESDPFHARRIINGLDCAKDIAGYYAVFATALADLKHPLILKA